MKPQNSRFIRSLLFALLLFALVSTAVELLLLAHDESFSQWIPIIVITLGVVGTVWNLLAGTPWSARAMRATMVALIAAGVLGIVLHYKGNVEFQKEVDPSLNGLDLVKKVLQSKTPPALAPGVLAHLGLLGIVCTYLRSEIRGTE